MGDIQDQRSGAAAYAGLKVRKNGGSHVVIKAVYVLQLLAFIDGLEPRLKPKFSDYPLEIRPLTAEEGGGILATVPDLPGCMADGETPEEAIADAGVRLSAGWMLILPTVVQCQVLASSRPVSKIRKR